jgi:hypothetical protein
MTQILHAYMNKRKKRIKYKEPLSIGSSPWSVAW